ncbi:MAG: hypothetical protein MUC49_20870 [Raineya sp.]|jgi:hypothetical protein|nr:hypothetical protein [Raineya sp.]
MDELEWSMVKISMILVFAILLCSGCYHSGSGRSDSSEHAKKIDVFTTKLKPLQNPIIINDTLQIYIKDVWIEKSWWYTEEGVLPSLKEYQICVNTNVLSRYGPLEKEWFIGEKPCHPYAVFEYTGSLVNNEKEKLWGITMTLDSIPTKDTLIWDIKMIDEIQKDTFCIHKYKFLGKFTLIKSDD